MINYNFTSFGTEHGIYLIVILIFWLSIPLLGKRFLNKFQKNIVALSLISISLVQEIMHYFYKMNLGLFTIAQDISLHMCGFSLFISCYALYSKNQTAFELAFFWGLGGALQAILTPDPTRFHFAYISTFWSFLAHGIIILNVLWLITAEGMRCRKYSLLNTAIVTNAAVFIVGIINKLIGNGANYWFICEKPSGDSPFLIGEWPYYLFTFQLAGFMLMAVIYFPMWLHVKRTTAKKIKTG